MKKLINDPLAYVDESLDGLCSAFRGYRRTGATGRVIARPLSAVPGQVGVVSGGGFGHLPLFAGYVGDGLLNACAVGNVFAGPPGDVCAETIRAADSGAGVVCVLGNYGGDRMSFGMACDEVGDDGIATETVIIADDIASAPPSERAKRRGVAGIVFSYKAAGAVAARGAPLADVAAAAAHASQRTRTLGVALSPCLIPGAAAPGFVVPDGMIEIGMGIHGEPGIEQRELPSADTVASTMIERLLADPADGAGRVALLVNSLGATPLEELLIVQRRARGLLGDAGLQVARTYTGHYATSMEMAGFSLSLLYLDDALDALLDAPVDCPFWPCPGPVLTAPLLASGVARMHARIAPIRQALDAADRELGDGDTGMTVEQIVSAWNGVAPALTGDVGAALSALARETRRVSGSSLGSVVAIGLATAGRTVQGRESLDARAIGTALRAAADAISSRSGAAPGDKTILDSLVKMSEAVGNHEGDGVLEACVAACERALEEFHGRECRVGRARIYGARSAGRDDPGMMAASLLLRALRD